MRSQNHPNTCGRGLRAFMLFTTTLRTFAPKSSDGEIFFISRLELVDKILTSKMKKNCFGENGSGKMP